MVNASIVKTKINAILDRSDLKRNIVVNHYTLADNVYGEPALVFGSQDIYNGIILNYRSYKHQHDPVGDFPNSEFIIYLSTDDSVGTNDIIEMFSNEYLIEGIDQFPLGAELVVKKIFVKEKQD